MKMKPALYFKTLRHLKLCQLCGQFRVKLLPQRTPGEGWKNAKRRIDPSVNISVSALDTNGEYLSRFALEKVPEGVLRLINADQMLEKGVWQYPKRSHLWNFNLHYFEYAAAMAGQYRLDGDRKWAGLFQRLYESWLENPTEDAFHPYTISLRLKNLLIAGRLFGDALSDSFREKLYGTLYSQYRYLERHAETALLGNHYFENICSVIIGSAFFSEPHILRKWENRLENQLAEQILPDGFHCERSPMYHKLMLESLIRAVQALRTAGYEEWRRFLSAIQKMLNAAVSMEQGADRTPLFNDSGDNVAKPLKALVSACDSLFCIRAEICDALPDAGYYFLKENNIFAVCDAGEMAPGYLMGHGHCDCLSFELFVNGAPVLVNCGTGLYQGAQRDFFRSTAAHNTFTVSGEEQAECWGEHRVAGRLSDVHAQYGKNILSASFRGYKKTLYTREIRLEGSVLTVSEQTDAAVGTMIESFLHIAPEFQLAERNDGCFNITENGSLRAVIEPTGAEVSVSDASYAPGFGEYSICTQLRFAWSEDRKRHGYKVTINTEEN